MNNNLNTPNSVFLIEANLNEIIEAMMFKDLSDFEKAFAQIQIFYLQSQIDKLKNLNFEDSNLSPFELMYLTELKSIRIALREKTLTKQQIQSFISISSRESPYKGDSLFVAAMGFETINDQIAAKQMYQLAAQELNAIGAYRKALKAFHNFVAAESRIHPESNNTVEWHMIYKKARKLKDRVCAASALNNLAREYQIMGSFKTALKYSTKALSLMGENKNTLNYFLTLLNHTHILFDLNSRSDALVAADEILASSHIEIKSALMVLAEKYQFNLNQKTLDHPVLLPTWQERLKSSPKLDMYLTDLESKVIDLLSKQKATKHDLIELLYGQNIDYESAENRLKNLLNRLRKKIPDKILFSEGFYSLRQSSK